MHIHTYIHTYVRTYIHTYVRTYVHTYIRTYVHTYIRTYVHTYIRTYVHTYIRTYVHLDNPTLLKGQCWAQTTSFPENDVVCIQGVGCITFARSYLLLFTQEKLDFYLFLASKNKERKRNRLKHQLLAQTPAVQTALFCCRGWKRYRKSRTDREKTAYSLRKKSFDLWLSGFQKTKSAK